MHVPKSTLYIIRADNEFMNHNDDNCNTTEMYLVYVHAILQQKRSGSVIQLYILYAFNIWYDCIIIITMCIHARG